MDSQLEILGYDVLMIVMDHLDVYGLRNLALTCKRYCELVEHYCKKRCKRENSIIYSPRCYRIERRSNPRLSYLRRLETYHNNMITDQYEVLLYRNYGSPFLEMDRDYIYVSTGLSLTKIKREKTVASSTNYFLSGLGVNKHTICILSEQPLHFAKSDDLYIVGTKNSAIVIDRDESMFDTHSFPTIDRQDSIQHVNIGRDVFTVATTNTFQIFRHWIELGIKCFQMDREFKVECKTVDVHPDCKHVLSVPVRIPSYQVNTNILQSIDLSNYNVKTMHTKLKCGINQVKWRDNDTVLTANNGCFLHLYDTRSESDVIAIQHKQNDTSNNGICLDHDGNYGVVQVFTRRICIFDLRNPTVPFKSYVYYDDEPYKFVTFDHTQLIAGNSKTFRVQNFI